METQPHTWVNVLISWAPFLLLIGFWIYFMRKFSGFGGRGNYIERHMKFMDRQDELLERIAIALERRNRADGPDDAGGIARRA
jgi:ATP-dependent Zn protease